MSFTLRQLFILENPIQKGETLTAWSRRLHSMKPEISADSFRNQISRFKKEGILELGTEDLSIYKVTTHPSGGETVVKTLKGPEVDTSGMAIEKVTTSPHGGQWVKYKAQGLSDDDIDRIINDILDRRTNIERLPYVPFESSSEQKLCVYISDDHIGLNTNPDGNALFPYKYNKQVYLEKMDQVFAKVMQKASNQSFEQIEIAGLGDMEDGWDGQTTRGGHDLPQNMTNDEVFDLAVDSRLELIQRVVENKLAPKITLKLVTNSNHTASFALIVAKTIKKICDRIYADDIVEIDILKRFMEYRIYGDHAFIYTHGKDAKYMRSGMPHVLDAKAEKFVKSYIDFHDLKRKAKHIHLIKGDSHRLGETDHKTFTYTSLRAFCPPSDWIGLNFGDNTNPGYAIAVVPKYKNEIDISHISLEYEKEMSKT